MHQFPSFTAIPSRVETLSSFGAPVIPLRVARRQYPQMTALPIRVEDLSCYGTGAGPTAVILPIWLFEPLMSLT